MQKFAFAALGLLLTAPGALAADKLGADLSRALAAGQAGEEVGVIVTLHGGPDAEEAARAVPLRSRRASRVSSLLRVEAGRSLSRVLPRVERAAGASAAAGVRPLWIINGFSLKVPAEAVASLAALPEVKAVLLDRTVALEAPVAAAAAAPEWNLESVGAPAAWSAGYTGQGVVVAVIDSGADVLHPDLASRWRGGSNSWFDPYGELTVAPQDTDPSGHGTGVTGLILGGDAGGTSIGVAPGAQWIAVRGFRQTGGSQAEATLSALFESLQWILDPDGDPATDDAPQVVNCSWGFGQPGTLSDPGADSFRQALKVLRAAGILTVFAAGNSGPSAGTSESPANYPESLAVGAVNDSGAVDASSSRGPSAFDGQSVYPSVVAPGVGVRTADLSLNGTSLDPYAARDGTSFAAPQVSGAAALLLSANPDLSVEDLFLELLSATVDMGDAGPDNESGYGWLDLSLSRIVRGQLPGSRSGVSLAPSAPGPLRPGAQVTFTATPADSAAPNEFRFWIAGPATSGAWRLARDYSAAPSWVWTVSAADSGVSAVVVHSRRTGSSLNYEAAAKTSFSVLNPDVAVSLAANPVSGARVDQTVVFTASASGTSDPLEFRFSLEGPGTAGQLAVVQDFSGSASWSWTPTAADAGTSRVRVEVRLQGAAGGAVQAQSELSVTVLQQAADSDVLPHLLNLPERGGCFVTSAPGRFRETGAAAVAMLFLAALLRGRRRGHGRKLVVPLLIAAAQLLSAAVPGSARAGEPNWSVHVLAGGFFSQDEDWREAFGSDGVFDGKIGAGYRLGKLWEVGVEGGYRRAVEDGSTDRKITVVPLQAYLLCQLRLKEDQRLVPYVAVGASRYQYWQEAEEESTRGYLWGYHGRAGLKVLLDNLDPYVSASAFGRKHTYGLVEVQYARVDGLGGGWVDLGGWSAYGGVAFEF